MTSQRQPVAGSRIDLELLHRVRDQLVDAVVTGLAERNDRPIESDDPIWLEFTRFGSWNQREWRAVSQDDDRRATSLCFAGLTVEACGGKWVMSPEQALRVKRTGIRPADVPEHVFADTLLAEPGDDPTKLRSTVIDGRLVHVTSAFDRARVKLGLTYSEAYDLFSGDNELPELLKQIEVLTVQERVRRARAARLADDSNPETSQ